MTTQHLPDHDTTTTSGPDADTDAGTDRAERRGTGRVVAVVGDPTTAAQAHRYATRIHDLAGLPSQVILLDHTGPRQNPRLDQPEHVPLPPETGAVVLTGTHTADTLRLGDAADPPPVLAEQDIAAIAVTAALLTTLTRRGRTPRASRVVIAGADTLPMLCRLLVAAGIGDITTWKHQDAVAFPLRRVAQGVDAVIDLLGVWPTPEPATGGSDFGEPAVIAPDAERDPLLALPGLVRAIAQNPDAALTIALDVEVHLACALALVMATPSHQQRPQVPNRDLADRVADAATQALDARVPHPRTSRSGRPAR
jgi:malate dehydrogenase (oxaloacetate-decarboxylating)